MANQVITPDKPIDEMTKKELADFALAAFGKELDPTRKRDELVAEVNSLMDDDAGQSVGDPPVDEDEKEKEKEKENPPSSKAQAMNPFKRADNKPDRPEGSYNYLKHSKNGRVYVSTPLLQKRPDMLPCDKNGKLL